MHVKIGALSTVKAQTCRSAGQSRGIVNYLCAQVLRLCIWGCKGNFKLG